MNHHTLQKPSVDGFESIKRYWDKQNNIFAAKILPGEYYVTKNDELITTVLGSCISACICDPISQVGGMNHFMLPETSKNRLLSMDEAVVGNATRYGNYAMEHLINTILSNGGKRKNLEVKLFGGGKIVANMSDVGKKNINFILEYIDAEALNLLSQDLGDIYPRKINYYPRKGIVKMKKIQDLHNDTIAIRETSYRKRIKDVPVESEIEIELF